MTVESDKEFYKKKSLPELLRDQSELRERQRNLIRALSLVNWRLKVIDEVRQKKMN